MKLLLSLLCFLAISTPVAMHTMSSGPKWTSLKATDYLNQEMYVELNAYLKQHLLTEKLDLAIKWIDGKAKLGIVPMIYYYIRYWVYCVRKSNNAYDLRHALAWTIFATILTKADIDCCVYAKIEEAVATLDLLLTQCDYRLKEFYSNPIKLNAFTCDAYEIIQYQKVLEEALTHLKAIGYKEDVEELEDLPSPGWTCTAAKDWWCNWIHFYPVTSKIANQLQEYDKFFGIVRADSFKQTIAELRALGSWEEFFAMKYNPRKTILRLI